MKRKETWTEEQLRVAVAEAYSYAGVFRLLGLKVGGSAYRAVKRKINEAGLDIAHFTGQAHNRGKSFPEKRRPIEDYLNNVAPTQSHSLKMKLIRAGIFKHQCAICGITEWLGKPTPIQLDHIDGNPEDNRLTNLRILCPNCHAQTETYCSKNRIKQAGLGELVVPGISNVSAEKRTGSSPVSRTPCPDCGKIKDRKAARCKSCAGRFREPTKIEWPSVDELKARLVVSNYSKLAVELGVSDNAIRKRIKNYS